MLTPKTITNGSALIVPNCTMYEFGVLTSKMHMIWMAYVCGRLESRFQYSSSIVYNNFPWPQNISRYQKKKVEEDAEIIFKIRKDFSQSSLAVLYDPFSMPPELIKAHQKLDKSVELCYRSQPFTSDSKRMEFLFELYEKYTFGLFAEEKPKSKKSKVV